MIFCLNAQDRVVLVKMSLAYQEVDKKTCSVYSGVDENSRKTEHKIVKNKQIE